MELAAANSMEVSQPATCPLGGCPFSLCLGEKVLFIYNWISQSPAFKTFLANVTSPLRRDRLSDTASSELAMRFKNVQKFFPWLDWNNITHSLSVCLSTTRLNERRKIIHKIYGFLLPICNCLSTAGSSNWILRIIMKLRSSCAQNTLGQVLAKLEGNLLAHNEEFWPDNKRTTHDQCKRCPKNYSSYAGTFLNVFVA